MPNENKELNVVSEPEKNEETVDIQPDVEISEEITAEEAKEEPKSANAKKIKKPGEVSPVRIIVCLVVICIVVAGFSAR